jgi:hypothetical protein
VCAFGLHQFRKCYKLGRRNNWRRLEADGKFFSATAKVDGATVAATSSDVAEPVFVRYGWANSPQCSIFNGEGLPASPFTPVR